MRIRLRNRLVSHLPPVAQEACRHIEIGESTETISAILSRHMPIHQIFVQRIDCQDPCLGTVAVGLAASEDVQPDARTFLLGELWAD